MSTRAILTLPGCLLAGAALLTAAEKPPPLVVSNVKVLSDRVEDVSSLEAWESSFTARAASDEARGLTVWHSIVKFVLNGWPPMEYLQNKDMVVDPIKIMNVYGYTFCGPHAAVSIALARQAGLEARGWALKGHIVPEIAWNGRWHMLDSSLVNYFPAGDGSPAGVLEIAQAVGKWLGDHPGYSGDAARLMAFQKEEGNRGWRRGPPLVAGSPFLDENGWYPARTHGWAATMQEYDGIDPAGSYEMPYSLGYRVNNRLRPGERLTFNWSNKGLHVNMFEEEFRNDPALRMGEGTAGHTRRFGDLAPGRIGNGRLEYEVPLSREGLAAAALRVEEIEFGPPGDDAIIASSRERPGVIELRMPFSYVYLTGRVLFESVMRPGGRVRLLFSDNQGLDWREIAEATTSGEGEADLSPLVFRRYDYRLRIELQGEGTALRRLRIEHDFQHSQRALPALGEGVNTITLSAGAPEGTVTFEGSLDPSDRGRQVLWSDYRPLLSGIDEREGWEVAGSQGSILLHLESPGDLVRLRTSIACRVRGAGDGWELAASFDGGTTYREAGRCEGPALNKTCSFAVEDVPAGTREAWVRLTGERRNAARIHNLRIDADYREPRGGFAPVEVTYLWEEGGKEHRDTHVALRPEERWPIEVGEAPRMKSLILKLAD